MPSLRLEYHLIQGTFMRSYINHNATSMAFEKNGPGEEPGTEVEARTRNQSSPGRLSNHDRDLTTSEDDEEDEEEEETEPSLKYTKLTGSLSQIYRNRDSTSAALVSGDKMVGDTKRECLNLKEMLILR